MHAGAAAAAVLCAQKMAIRSSAGRRPSWLNQKDKFESWPEGQTLDNLEIFQGNGRILELEQQKTLTDWIKKVLSVGQESKAATKGNKSATSSSVLASAKARKARSKNRAKLLLTF